MQILSFPEAVVPLEFRLGQVRLQDQAWPSEQPSGPEPWHDPLLRPMSMLLSTTEESSRRLTSFPRRSLWVASAMRPVE